MQIVNKSAANGISEKSKTAEITTHLFFFQAEDGIRDLTVTGETCALPISSSCSTSRSPTRWCAPPKASTSARSYTRNNGARGHPPSGGGEDAQGDRRAEARARERAHGSGRPQSC